MTKLEELYALRETILRGMKESDKECREAGLDYRRLRFYTEDNDDLKAINALINIEEERVEDE